MGGSIGKRFQSREYNATNRASILSLWIKKIVGMQGICEMNTIATVRNLEDSNTTPPFFRRRGQGLNKTSMDCGCTGEILDNMSGKEKYGQKQTPSKTERKIWKAGPHLYYYLLTWWLNCASRERWEWWERQQGLEESFFLPPLPIGKKRSPCSRPGNEMCETVPVWRPSRLGSKKNQQIISQY